MDFLNLSRRFPTRRELLKTGAVGLLPLAIPRAASLLLNARPPQDTANGGTDPYPIPSLDKNGSHNQPAGANLEPSHIYHFKGRVARSSTFTGMGTDNQGNRIAFGSPTTDYGVMQGEYWAARAPQQGTFTHI
jgi:hypothetical protein